MHYIVYIHTNTYIKNRKQCDNKHKWALKDKATGCLRHTSCKKSKTLKSYSLPNIADVFKTLKQVTSAGRNMPAFDWKIPNEKTTKNTLT